MYPLGPPSLLNYVGLKGRIAARDSSISHLKRNSAGAMYDEKCVVRPVKDPYEVWHKVLIAYTSCDLFGRNTLVDISAFARQIQRETKDDYLAGLWRRHLDSDLLWTINPNSEWNENTSWRFEGPTWSWAGMRIAIIPYTNIGNESLLLIQILAVDVTPKTSDTFGELSSGYVRLRCWLKRIRSGSPREGSLNIASEIWKGVQLDAVQEREMQELWCLPILTSDSSGELEVHGLVLQKVKKDIYQRAGVFKVEVGLAMQHFQWLLYHHENEDKEGCNHSSDLSIGTSISAEGYLSRVWRKFLGEDEGKEQIITLV
jgi:hypothetical protein